MELQSPLLNSVRAKSLWKALKVIFSVIRKGLISKAKLLMDLNLILMLKRGHTKLMEKCLASSFVSRSPRVGSFGVSEYEFSCSNSPNLLFFRNPKKKQVFLFLSCLRFPKALEDAFGGAHVPRTPEYLSNFHLDASFDHLLYNHRPLSPYAESTSNYSVEMDDGSDRQVDHDAEEFIKRFYEQLRAQSPICLHR